MSKPQKKLVYSAIFVPKIFTVGLNLTVLTKISLHSFFRHGILGLRIHAPVHPPSTCMCVRPHVRLSVRAKLLTLYLEKYQTDLHQTNSIRAI